MIDTADETTSVHPKYPNRNISHRWLSPPGECEQCGGRGWTYDAEGFETFADCECGRLRASFYEDA